MSFDSQTMKLRKNRAELNRGVDSDYFGLRDDDDGVLVKLEGPAEKRMRAALEREWQEKEAQREAARWVAVDARCVWVCGCGCVGVGVSGVHP